MKKILFFLISLSFTLNVFASDTKYVLAFAGTIENKNAILNELKMQKGILSVKFCENKKAFVLECDENIFPKLELVDIALRTPIEKISSVKFYFSELSNPYFSDIICN